MKTAFSTRLPLVVGMCITGAVALFGLGAAALRPKAVAKVSSLTIPTAQLALQPNCRTIAADPQPPLNIRSTPQAKTSENLVGTAPNGTIFKVIAVQSQWLQVSQPIQGWIYQPLTSTNCQTPNGIMASADTGSDFVSPTRQIILQAKRLFDTGKLTSALALLESIPQTDTAYEQAQETYRAMTAQWQAGNQAYQTAKTSLNSGNWQQALQQINEMPSVQYWHQKMAPIVKQAIVQQSQTPIQ